MNRNKTLILILLCACSWTLQAQVTAWVVPADQQGKANPLTLLPKNVAVGKNIFSQSCVSCHGAKADGNGLIKSANLISKDFQQQTDGAIFYKLSTGKGQMPSFKSLKEEERWAVVNYLRVLVNPSAVPAAADVKITVTSSDSPNAMTAFVTTADSAKKPIAEMDVHFYVQRSFGLMRVGRSSNLTTADGKVTVIVPENIIGDSAGNIILLTKIENNILYNDAVVSITKQWGKKLVTKEYQFNQRELWGTQDKAPIWLLLMIAGGLMGVFSAIAYVINSLFKIKKAGKIFTK